jgi:hypothetical protein
MVKSQPITQTGPNIMPPSGLQRSFFSFLAIVHPPLYPPNLFLKMPNAPIINTVNAVPPIAEMTKWDTAISPCKKEYLKMKYHNIQ